MNNKQTFKQAGLYIIFNRINNLFWSNDIGWVDKTSATEFTKEETEYLNLPLDGQWVLKNKFTYKKEN
jgi:hypothetical protein